MQPETCHVVFVKSILFDSPSSVGKDGSERDSSTSTHPTSAYPDISNDPFSPTKIPPVVHSTDNENDPPPPYQQTSPTMSAPSASLRTKPAPPPTASILELPTCPVCLERMDET